MCEISRSFRSHPGKHVLDHAERIDPKVWNELGPADPIDPTGPNVYERVVSYTSPPGNLCQRACRVDPARVNMWAVVYSRSRSSHAGNPAYKSRGTHIPRRATMCAELDHTTHKWEPNIYVDFCRCSSASPPSFGELSGCKIVPGMKQRYRYGLREIWAKPVFLS